MKIQKNEERRTYKMSDNRHECISIYYFELNFTAMSIDKFQLTEEHDQAQNNIIILPKHFQLAESNS